MSQGQYHSPHIISSAGILSSLIITRGVSVVQLGRERERDHIHISLIMIYFYDCSILLLVIAINFFLGLTYKLNFIISVYIYRKNYSVCIGFSIILDFKHLLGVLECIPYGQGGTTILYTM